MTARAMWKAEVVADSFRVPVKVYAAVQDQNIHFRMLHSKDLTPVVQQMVDARNDQPIPKEQIKKGIEVDPGVFVMLTDEEQDSLDPPESREINVEQVVDREKVDERWYDRPYYLGPDGDTDSYFALAEAFAGDERIGISRWTMRKKRYVGALHSRDGYLLLDTLRFSEEVVDIEGMPAAGSRKPDERELALAEQIVGALEDEFQPDQYHDEYRAQVMKLIDSKGKGKVIRFPKEKVTKPDVSLMEALEASLNKVKG
jgi:DNA end-binding protein Ku